MSLLYSTDVASPSVCSVMFRVRSKVEVPASTSTTLSDSPGASCAFTPAFCRMNMTWKRVEWLMSRSSAPGPRLSASTIISKGRSWCAYASSATSLHLPHQLAEGHARSRRGIQLRAEHERVDEQPDQRLELGLAAVGDGVPTHMSVWPV